MSDFREFSRQYNDWLMHADFPGKRKKANKWDTDDQKENYGSNSYRKPPKFGKDKDDLKETDWMKTLVYYINDENVKRYVSSGQPLVAGSWREAISILQGGYNNETKRRLINHIQFVPKSVYKNGKNK